MRRSRPGGHEGRKEKDMRSYIKYEQEGETFTKNMECCTLDQVLGTAASMYAWDDCTGIEVLEIVHEGKRYEYNGWEPGMTFTFCDETGDEVWSHSFPSWDH